MAIGFRAAGTWENGSTGLTADEVVAVPAAQVTGDLMLLIGCWKDYAITAQVSGWTELFELADGTASTGNGTGSMKVGIWYKEATSDAESDPTLDFSTTTGLVGEAVISVFSKGAGDTWIAPTYVVGAWDGGNEATTRSASTTITVPDGAAVVSVLAIRDDSSTFTRGNTAIDDADGLVTWAANYVEAPATHASTTTGNDMSADAGYRLVTTGATAVTLRQTATLNANETGQCAWIVLAVKFTQTITLGLVDGSATVYQPTLTPKSSLALGLVDGSAATYQPTLTPKNAVSLGLVDGSAATYQPTLTITGGPQDVTLGLVDGAAATYQPTVAHLSYLTLPRVAPPLS